MKRFWANNPFFLFLSWKILIYLTAFLSVYFFIDFGDKFPYYREVLISTGLPYWLWGFGNFDGVHYIRIATSGYNFDYTQVFFPLYPLLINLFSFGNYHLIAGLVISGICLILSLRFLLVLYRSDHDQFVSWKAICLLLSFPTAFYFGAVYTESLFLLLVILFFLFLKRNQFIFAGLIAGLASATRIFGILLTPILLLEIYHKARSKQYKTNKSLALDLASLILAPVGLVLYSIYLKFNFGDAFYFLTAQPVFGAERSDFPIITLPQVLYRYIKIFLSIPVDSSAFFTATLEFASTIFVLILLIVSFRKVRFDYWLFSLGCLLLPTLTGTLSSVPRYALMSFLLFPTLVKTLGRYYWIVLLLFSLLEVLLLMMFVRGYWIA